MGLFDHMNLLADLCTNHRGDRDLFVRLCAQVEDAGAIAKIQLFSEATFPRSWAYLLNGINFIPSVFRPEDVDFILPYRPLALKVASVEATYWDLIKRCCQEDLPLIVSTGGMDEEEISDLIEVTEAVQDLCLMHCVSIYPTSREQLNLWRLAALSGELAIDDRIIIGWSSHYPVVDQAAYALAWAWGATQFEVHVRPQYFKRGAIPMIDEVIEELSHLETPDEQCAFTPHGLKQIRVILESLPVLEGSENYIGPDREAVLEWRKRWQKPEQ